MERNRGTSRQTDVLLLQPGRYTGDVDEAPPQGHAPDRLLDRRIARPPDEPARAGEPAAALGATARGGGCVESRSPSPHSSPCLPSSGSRCTGCPSTTTSW